MEGANFIANGKLVKLSDQQLIDCSTDGNQGCKGGHVDNAYTYAMTNRLETAAEYPYKGHSFAKCTHKEGSGIVGVTKFVDVTPEDPD